MRLAKIGLLIIFIVLFASSVHALSLRGDKLSPIVFEPGKKIVNHYIVEDTKKEVKVSVGGELIEYVRVTEVINNEFDLIIEVPENLPAPGTYWFSLSVTEVGESEKSGVGSLVSVNLRFLVEVPPHGKSISVSFEVPDVNEHEVVPLSVNVVSKGLEAIHSLTGTITIYDQENISISTVKLTETTLPALGSTTLSASLSEDKLAPGKYWAEALITYDGHEERAQDNFKVGYLDLILVNYTSRLEQGFSEFKVTVENNWGNSIQMVYAIVYINGNELLITPTISLGPWEKSELKGLLKTDFQPGDHEGEIHLFYDGLSKIEKVTFLVLEPKSEVQQKTILITVLSIIILISILVSIIFLMKRKKK